MAGDLDITFDGDGKVTTDFATTDFGGALDRAYSAVIQSDGKIVVAGTSFTGNGEQYNFALTRYNSNGSLDTTFDGDGKVTTDFGGGDDAAFSATIQSDGKIVVAGESYNGSKRFDFAIIRYNSNGSLDTTFDGDGKVTTDFGGTSDDRAYSVAIQGDGKIVVAGYSKSDFALTRYNSNGSLDTTFDGDGKVTTSVGSSFFTDIENSVAIQSDGKIVVAGFSTKGSNLDFALARYNSNGSLDTTFDGDGKVTTGFGSSTNDVAHSVAIQSDGKIVVAGFSETSGIFDSKDFALTRYNSNGSLDSTFDGDGKVTTDFGRNLDDRANSVAIQSDGKIVVAGESKNVRSGYDFALTRYNSNGSLDTTFDGDGKVTTAVGLFNYGANYGALSVAIQSDGKIVAAGDGPGDFALARYNVSDAPTDITLSFTSIAENAPANTTVGTLSTIDPDSGNTFTYSLVSGTGSIDNAAFNISGDSLRATSSFDFETKSSYSIRIRSTDQGGLFTERTFTITVININESPTNISLSSSTIAENAAANTPVGTMSTADPDADNSFTYTLVAGSGDADNAAFDIAGSILRATNTFNFEIKSSYTVRVRTTDQGGLFTEKMFTITVTNVNEPPMDIALSSTSIPENVGANAVVGTLSTADPDAGNTFTYNLVAGTGSTDNGAFNISGNTLRATSSLDFETKNSYTVRIRTTDQGGLFFEKAFTITVTEANEAPADIALSSTSIAENSPANTKVGTMSMIDPNAGDTFTYTLVSGTGSTDNGAFNIIGSTLRATSSFDFEAKNSYNVRIRTTDRGGLSTEKTFTIAVTDMVVGDLDNTFDGDGKVTTAVGSSLDAAHSVAMQSDGKIVVAGYSDNGSNIDFALMRYNSNGSLDTTFDGDGKVTTAVGSSHDAAHSVAIQSDGKIVVAGYSDNGSNYEFSLTRYNSNGSLDTTFDGDGKVTTDFGSSDTAYSVAIQSDGKIVVAGYSWNGSNWDCALTRYNSNGSLDTTFDGDGKVTTDFGNSDDFAYSAAVQSDGKILVAGESFNGSNRDFALMRYNSNGSLDTTFDGDGKVTTDFGNSNDFANSVAIQSNGKILVAGQSFNDNNWDFTLTRYNSNGSLDTTFDSDGKVTTDFGNSDDDGAFSVAIQSDGKIVVAGYSYNRDLQFALTRYNSNGSLDTTFAFDGMVTTAVGNSADGAYSVAIQSDGKIVAAGYSDNGSNRDFALTRYNVDFNRNPTDISLSSTSIAENAGINATVGTMSTADPDAGNSFTYTLVAGIGDLDNSAFNFAGPILRASSSLDFEAKPSYTIRIRSMDQNGLFIERQFVITVTNVNESPNDIRFSSSGPLIDFVINGSMESPSVLTETQFFNGQTIGSGWTVISGNSAYIIRDVANLGTSPFGTQFLEIHGDTVSQLINGLIPGRTYTLSYYVTLRTTSSYFGDGRITASIAGQSDVFDYSLFGNHLFGSAAFPWTKRSLSFTATNSSESLVISGTGAFNQDPFVAIDNVSVIASIPENMGANAPVGVLESTDPDIGSSFFYSLVAGEDNADNTKFIIDGATLRSIANLDFESKSKFTIRVRATDQGGLFTEESFTIHLTNVNEEPTDINLSAASIPENSEASAVIGALSTLDVDAGDTFSYSLVAGTGDLDNNAFTLTGSNLRASSSFDFETKSSYTIRIRSTDQGGLFVEKVFTIRVLNANDAPVAVADSYWVSVGTPRMLDVLANDSDVDSLIDPTSIRIVQPPAHGTAVPMLDGTVRYIPDDVYRGVDGFTYRVSDSLGLFSNAVTVQLGVNSAPKTNPDSLVVKQTITTVLDVLRNDSNPDGTLDPATLEIVSGSEMADLVVQADGTIRFTPQAGFLGTARFRYVVSDNDGRPSVPTDVTVLVVVSIYQNPRSRFDVDDDGTVSPLDVLVLINLLNSQAPSLPVDGLPGPPAYVDVNADNRVDPLDVLDLINHMNSLSNGEGEGDADRTIENIFASDDWREELRKSNRLRLTKLFWPSVSSVNGC